MEKILQLLIADREEFRHDLKQLLTAQVVQQAEIENLRRTAEQHTKRLELQRAKDRDLDMRVDKLVSGTGEFIRNRPNTQL